MCRGQLRASEPLRASSLCSFSVVETASLRAYNLIQVVRREDVMPVYEFLCKACQKTFSRILTMAEHDTGKVVCPHCGSHDVEQNWADFYAITSKKSAA